MRLLLALLLLFGCGKKDDEDDQAAPSPTPTTSPGSGSGEIRIGAFNLHQFGQTKAGKADILEAIAKIAKRYDVIALQEVRDQSGEAQKALADKMGAEYARAESDRLGSSSNYKESYLFFYKTSLLSNVSTLQFSDSGGRYEREPFALIADYGSRKYSFVVLHADPDKVTSELGNLYSDLAQLSSKSASDNVLILGDLNADCSYLSDKEYEALQIKSDATYSWVIGKDVDTTTGKSDCAYDRILVKGSVSQKSAGVYKYDSDIGSVAASDVSDHYPVEVVLEKK